MFTFDYVFDHILVYLRIKTLYNFSSIENSFLSKDSRKSSSAEKGLSRAKPRKQDISMAKFQNNKTLTEDC